MMPAWGDAILKFDDNKDGKISLEEIMAHKSEIEVGGLQMTDEQVALLEKAFKDSDINNDGEVSREEYKAVLGKLSFPGIPDLFK